MPHEMPGRAHFKEWQDRPHREYQMPQGPLCPSYHLSSGSDQIPPEKDRGKRRRKVEKNLLG